MRTRGNVTTCAGHGDVSEALAERVLLPRVREADDRSAVIANGSRAASRSTTSTAADATVHDADLLAAALQTDDQQR